MSMIDADMAQPGLTIVANSQKTGKGQRGRNWVDTPGQSLLMSIIICPNRPLNEQFIFNASAANAIADVLHELYKNWDIRIKWPNDIIVNDKKAGGVLIENVLRGNKWVYSIIGLGLNIKQEEFSMELPFATSLKIGSGKGFEISELLKLLREKILEYTNASSSANRIMEEYNEHLYRRGEIQSFTDSKNEWDAIILGVNNDGTLKVQTEEGRIVSYTHGSILWNWGLK